MTFAELRERATRTLIQAGHAINANNGRCPVIEDALIETTTLAIEMVKLVDGLEKEVLPGLHRIEEQLKASNATPGPTSPPEKIDPVWPSEKLAKEMAAGCEGLMDQRCHILALLQRVRTLERALQAAGFFTPPGDSEGWWAKWRESVEYVCDADALLDAFHVPTRKDGKALYLKERIELLGMTANRRRRLAYDLFTQFEKEYGTGIRNGNLPLLKPLWDRAREEFDAKQDTV